MKSGRAWLVLSLGDERQYAGNDGYVDELQSVYRYDSFVANHRQIARGDLLILCNKERVLGLANIIRLESFTGTKKQLKCPECGRTVDKERKYKRPRYKCTGRHAFDEPVVADRPCTHFEAWFDGTFQSLEAEPPIPVAQVRAACPRYNEQLAMQEVELSRLEGAALSLQRKAMTVVNAPLRDVPMVAQVSDGQYTPNTHDERERIEREINARRGQPGFRRTMRERFNDTCLVTRCKLPDLLEAAHIAPYRGDKDHHPSNGLLLRADIHTLFDLDLLGIEPATLKVHLHPKVKGMGYEEWAGASLACDARLLSRDALESRWKKFQSRQPVGTGADSR